MCKLAKIKNATKLSDVLFPNGPPEETDEEEETSNSETESNASDVQVEAVTFVEKLFNFRHWLSENNLAGNASPGPNMGHVKDPETQWRIQVAACRFLGNEAMDNRKPEGRFYSQLHQSFCSSCKVYNA